MRENLYLNFAVPERHITNKVNNERYNLTQDLNIKTKHVIVILSCHQSSSLRSHMRSACALPISVFAFRWQFHVLERFLPKMSDENTAMSGDVHCTSDSFPSREDRSNLNNIKTKHLIVNLMYSCSLLEGKWCNILKPCCLLHTSHEHVIQSIPLASIGRIHYISLLIHATNETKPS